MKDLVEKLDAFLQFNERDILQNAGAVSHQVALKLAEAELAKFQRTEERLMELDFDQLVKKTKKAP